jgi:hypothetical protein
MMNSKHGKRRGIYEIYDGLRKVSEIGCAFHVMKISLMRGNVSFRNISRYSRLSEKIFSRQFGEPSDFTEFDSIGIKMIVMPQTFINIGAIAA